MKVGRVTRDSRIVIHSWDTHDILQKFDLLYLPVSKWKDLKKWNTLICSVNIGGSL